MTWGNSRMSERSFGESSVMMVCHMSRISPVTHGNEHFEGLLTGLEGILHDKLQQSNATR